MPTTRSLLYVDYTKGAYYTLTIGAYYTLTIRTRYSLLPPPSTIRRRSQLRMAPRSGTSCGLGVVGSGRIRGTVEDATEGGEVRLFLQTQCWRVAAELCFHLFTIGPL